VLFTSGAIQDRYHATVEIYRHDLLMEERAHGPDSKCLVKKPPVEKGTVYGIDALLKNKENSGRGTNAVQGCEHEEPSKEREGIEYAAPGHSYRRVDSLNHHSNHGSFCHAWE
jgi:hypothetical protein